MDSILKVIICAFLIVDMFICGFTMLMHFEEYEKGFAYIDAFRFFIDVIVFILILCFT